MNPVRVGRARAHANIALIKYWGKLPKEGNYPAVPSLSLTLDGLVTTTEVAPQTNGDQDQVLLDDQELFGPKLARVSALLDRCRQEAGVTERVRVVSHNHFPTNAGLASSASGFAALVGAARMAFGLDITRPVLSAEARRCSASAARSVYGGWVTLDVGAEAAKPLADGDYWPLGLLVVQTTKSEKPLGSTEAMNHTRATSPYYDSWVQTAPKLHAEARAALTARNLTHLGTVMEQSTWMMHACLLAARPGFAYFTPTTLAVTEQVRALRNQGEAAYFTMDAGPHVKVLCHAERSLALMARLREVPGVVEVTLCTPGPGLELAEGGGARW